MKERKRSKEAVEEDRSQGEKDGDWVDQENGKRKQSEKEGGVNKDIGIDRMPRAKS